MQLFFGGACAGKRTAVRRRFAAPVWHSAYRGQALRQWRRHTLDGDCLVLEGWERWIAEALGDEPDDDRLRAGLVAELEALRAWENDGMVVVLLMREMGRGIVPMARAERRLRDLNGWLVQDAAARCDRVWYVWHGLERSLSY